MSPEEVVVLQGTVARVTKEKLSISLLSDTLLFNNVVG